MSALCPSCRWPVRVAEGAIATHPRYDTGAPCDGSGTVPGLHPSTAAGSALQLRLAHEAHEAAQRADDDDMHTHGRIAARTERDLLRRLLRWVPEEVARAEREAVEQARRDDARVAALLEEVA